MVNVEGVVRGRKGVIVNGSDRVIVLGYFLGLRRYEVSGNCGEAVGISM